MDPVFKAVVFAIATAFFAVEAILGRSILAGGLAFFSLPFTWDAIDAASA